MSPIYTIPFDFKVKNEKRLGTEIPLAIVEQSGVVPGEPLRVSVEQNGDIVFRRLTNEKPGRAAWSRLSQEHSAPASIQEETGHG